MANNTSTQPKSEELKNNKQEKEQKNSDKTLWRPTDNQTKPVSQNPTGIAGESPSSNAQTGDPGRTPGKAEGEDIDE
jgi:hypothetical protein